MLQKYLVTLVLVVLAVTYAASHLTFVAHSAVAAGTRVDEHLTYEFFLNTGNHTYHAVDAEAAQFLGGHIGLSTGGSAHLAAAEVTVVPRAMSWTRNKQRYYARGALLTVDFSWDTPPDERDGAAGQVYLDLPDVSRFEGSYISLLSGSWATDSGGLIIRTEAAYRDPLRLGLARSLLALSLGLPVGIIVHAVGWYFLALPRERAARIAALPEAGSGLPRTFHPDPVIEWSAALGALCLFAVFAALMFADSTEGLVSYSGVHIAYMLMAAGAVCAPLAAAWAGSRALTVRVEDNGIAFARGRTAAQWTCVPWTEVTGKCEKSNRGNYWIELEFRGQWSKLKIREAFTVDYPILRGLLHLE
jgi:hypothetical protein